MHALLLALMIQAAGVPPQPGCAPGGTPSDTHPGFQIVSGWTLDEFEGREYGVEYQCKGAEGIIVLQRLEKRTADGLPVWTTIAERKIAVPKDNGLLEGGVCKLQGSDPDAEIVPIGHYSKAGAAIVTRAYRASRAHGAIEVLKTTVTCEVEGDD